MTAPRPIPTGCFNPDLNWTPFTGFDGRVPYGKWDVFLVAVLHPGTGVEYFITALMDPRGWFNLPPHHKATRYIWIATLDGPTEVGQADAPSGLLATEPVSNPEKLEG